VVSGPFNRKSKIENRKWESTVAAADEPSRNHPGPFDLRTIKNLVALMSRHDLSEIDLREGELRIRLRRGPLGTAAPAVPPPAAAPAPAAALVTAVPQAAPEADQAPRGVHLIKSPTIGTFYSRPKPDADPFVRVGSRVTPTTVVCVVEAMKIFNEIQAECTGVITEILANDQQPVEFNQVLFKVDTSA
jgi:acetyl-CoA carboxylase biotin carboxyl carrier protein